MKIFDDREKRTNHDRDKNGTTDARQTTPQRMQQKQQPVKIQGLMEYKVDKFNKRHLSVRSDDCLNVTLLSAYIQE